MKVIAGIIFLAALASGCSSVCDEVADEAEAGGCALGVLPADDDGEELTTCEGVREARAQCLLDITDNVCAITDEQADELAACYEAADQSSTDAE